MGGRCKRWGFYIVMYWLIFGSFKSFFIFVFMGYLWVDLGICVYKVSGDFGIRFIVVMRFKEGIVLRFWLVLNKRYFVVFCVLYGFRVGFYSYKFFWVIVCSLELFVCLFFRFFFCIRGFFRIGILLYLFLCLDSVFFSMELGYGECLGIRWFYNMIGMGIYESRRVLIYKWGDFRRFFCSLVVCFERSSSGSSF